MLVGRSTTRGALSDVVLHLHLMLRGRFGFAVATAVFPTVTRLSCTVQCLFTPRILCCTFTYYIYVLLAKESLVFCVPR